MLLRETEKWLWFVSHPLAVSCASSSLSAQRCHILMEPFFFWWIHYTTCEVLNELSKRIGLKKIVTF